MKIFGLVNSISIQIGRIKMSYVAIREVTPVATQGPFCRKGCSDYLALWSGMAQNPAYSRS